MRNHEIVFNKSNILFWVSIVLFLIACGNTWFMVNELGKMKFDSRLVGYTSVMRSSLQRVAKLALAGESNTDVLNQVDLLFTDFRKQASSGKFIRHGLKFVKKTEEIERRWIEEKRLVQQYMSDPSQANRTALLLHSELSWGIVGDIIQMAQNTAEEQIRFFRLILFMLGLNVAVSFFIIWNIRTYVQKKLEYLASHDTLTRILNRYSFNTILTNEVARSRRYKSPLSLIMFDIDFFKIVNDTYGHKTGDLVLRGVARAVAARVRGNDMVFRVGGEEFTILAVESDLENSASLAERLRRIIEATDFKEVGRVTVSFGVAQHLPAETEESFFQRTDVALYKAKSEGRNRVVVDKSVPSEATQHI